LKPENVLVCLDQSELRDIYDNGQLHQNRNIKTRLKNYKRHLRAFNGEEVSESEEEPAQPEQARAEEAKPESQKPTEIAILTEEDLEREYERLLREGNITHKNEKKNLRKKLKQKLKRAKTRTTTSTVPKEQPKPVITAPVPTPTIPRFVNGRHIDNGQKGGLNFDFKIKIADLGNGCWMHHHFQPEIQTRQYRSPEVILGIKYNESADIWSLACMVFELLTGEFLFDPKKDANYKKSTDHLALMMEMLNTFPASYSTSGTNSKKYVDAQGNLRKIPSLHYMGLKDVMMKRHGIKESEAAALADFLEPMLRVFPHERASAEQMLSHPWLEMDTEDFFATEEDITEAPNAYDKRHVNQEKFVKVVNDELFDADNSFGDKVDEDEESDDEYPTMYDRETKVFDRSFKQVYVGYADGIDLNALDSTSNWQFARKHKVN